MMGLHLSCMTGPGLCIDRCQAELSAVSSHTAMVYISLCTLHKGTSKSHLAVPDWCGRIWCCGVGLQPRAVRKLGMQDLVEGTLAVRCQWRTELSATTSVCPCELLQQVRSLFEGVSLAGDDVSVSQLLSWPA